jgi:peptidoglycan/xylan/chitin deacetylase (PgdA/CDA1 family)
LQALSEVVDLVSVDEILAIDRQSAVAVSGRRPAVAVTFDDDLPSHVTQALPLLLELRVPAAFFLSGRALHGLGPYWFQRLETLLLAHGEARTAALLGVPTLQPSGLALACEQDTELRKRVVDFATNATDADVLQADGIAALANAGMTIGFHTLDHDVLPDMNEECLNIAVARGRNELAAAAATTVRYFAYPHGKADDRAATAVRRARFDAAFTGHPKPLRMRDDRYDLGRWEPGPLGVDDLLATLVVRLHRAAPRLASAP